MTESADHSFAWTVAPDHPALAGHFPCDPLLPATAILDWLDELASEAFGRGLAGASTQAKFLRPARPGERLQARLTAKPNGGFGFEIRIGEELAVSGRSTPASGASA
ncbi:MAG: hypothetical protein P8Y78_05845 [Acidihalobacter sp.]|jgi:3-hydroxyacyl-[acyl-carrier-protein] dehydratase